MATGEQNLKSKKGKNKNKINANTANDNTVNMSLEDHGTEDGAERPATPTENIQTVDVRKAVELLSLAANIEQRANAGTAAKTEEEARKRDHHFWKTQPVPWFGQEITENCAIEPDKPLSELRQEPYSLPGGFVWSDVKVDDSTQLDELYELLHDNYVEDDDNMFRFDYSREFLLWALKPPGWLPVWHCGVRVDKNRKLIAFIAAIPCTVRVYNHIQRVVEINFLCVHKKLRSKRVAPVLIKEITRRVNLQGIFQAVYTAGVVLPRPVSTCRYWHRSLNPKKLIDVNFSHLGKNMTVMRTQKLYKLPPHPQVKGFRALTTDDLARTHVLLTEFLNRFNLAQVFDYEEFVHWFTPRENIVQCYVVENDGLITDFVSFYALPSTVMHHTVHKSLNAAYAFYSVANSTPWPELMTDVLVMAKNAGFDVFNALDLMENKQFLEKLKFGQGDGNLQYYIYNWKCPQMPAEKLALVLQ